QEFLQKIDSLQVENDNLLKEIGELDQSLAAKEDALNKVLADLKNQKISKQEFEAKFQESNKQMLEFKAKYNTLQERYDKLQREYNALQEKYNALLAENQTLRDQLAQKDQLIAELQAKLERTILTASKQEAVLNKTIYVSSMTILGKKKNGETYRNNRIKPGTDILSYEFQIGAPEGVNPPEENVLKVVVNDPKGSKYDEFEVVCAKLSCPTTEREVQNRLAKGAYKVRVNYQGKEVLVSGFTVN
ncbi:MAG: hypothetical protein RMM53_11085, partial [Bacteroidia bacterium]|nr:hypothetical protein [Bacteroidia bacterium]